MQVLALSGWAQYAASLGNVLPDDAHRVDYGDCTTVEAVFKRLSLTPEPDVAVGWSLGGQLLVRAVAAQAIRPKHLVLLGAPYQLVANAHFRGGRPKMATKALRMAFTLNADALLQKFQADFLAEGDCHAEHIKNAAPHFLAPAACNEWLFWLDQLIEFSCKGLDFSAFPRTDIIHGKQDAVIPFANAERFAECIPHAVLHALPDCGHAPHWHNANFVKTVIVA
jgi:pimeloyl-[acyl-carrier protein] methyl ester esterase